MKRSRQEGVVIGFLNVSKGIIAYRIWLLYEAEETTLEAAKDSLKMGDWIALIYSESETNSNHTEFEKIDQILPTEVVAEDTVQIQTTVVFDEPNRAERLGQNGFIVHSRYFGRVAALSPFTDAVAGVPYEGIFVQRICDESNEMGVSWFVPNQPLRHPLQVPDAAVDAIEGVVVSRHSNVAYLWTPTLGEGMCLNGSALKNGDWVKFRVQAQSLRKKFTNPNIHYYVADWERTNPILEATKCRNSLELKSRVNVGDAMRSWNSMIFAEWVGPVLDKQHILRDKVMAAGAAQWNKIMTVLLERLKKSVQEPVTVWNIKKAWFEPEEPTISSAPMSENSRSYFAERGRNDGNDDGFPSEDAEEQQFNSDRVSTSSYERITTREAYDTDSPRRTPCDFARNAANDERPITNTAVSSRDQGREEEDESLMRALRLTGMLFRSAEVRAAIQRSSPSIYSRLCRYYRFEP